MEFLVLELMMDELAFDVLSRTQKINLSLVDLLRR